MEGGCWSYCALLSAFGCILLVNSTQTGCGLAIKAEYQFLPIRKDPELGETSLIAGGIYLATCLISLALAVWKQRTCRPVDPPIVPVKSAIEMTESEDYTAYKGPNPEFTRADASSSLLA